MSKFQIILLVVFGVFILGAVLVFALYRGTNSQGAIVTVWGSIPDEDFSLMLNNSGLSQDNLLGIRYMEKSQAVIEDDFTEALARGEGPDLIIMDQSRFWENKSKLIPIPYSSVGARDFSEAFAEGGEIYLAADGIYGLPLTIDPLVLYYNRDHLSSAGISKPLQYWDEIYAQVGNLTKRDAAGNLVRSGVALGETKNIKNHKDLFALLLLQAGSPITGFAGNELRSYLNEGLGLSIVPADSALEFYTQFSNPTKTFYSWNRTLPEAQTRFTSGDLTYYIGYASELRSLRGKNPTLNFAVAPVPQSRISGRNLTTGKIYAVSITRGAANPAAALSAASKLAAPKSVSELSAATFVAPSRRDLLSLRPSDSILPVFYAAALQTRSWVDPGSAETEKIFADMIERVTSGRARTTESISKADTELRNLIRN